MAKKKAGKLNIFTCIFATVIIVGLVLAIVGMCIDVIKGTVSQSNVITGDSSKSSFIKLFGEEWADIKKMEAGDNTFLMVSFIVTIVGLAILLIDSCLHLFLKKDLKIIRIVGAALSIVGAILILIAGLTLASTLTDKLGASGGIGGIFSAEAKYTAAVGVWLGFVGGLVGGVAGGLGLLKKFN